MRSGPSSPIAILYRSELRMLLRDRRTIFASLVLPVLMLPLLLFMGQITDRGREERLAEATFNYAVLGDAADQVRGWIAAASPLVTASDEALRLEEVAVADPEEALAAQELHFYLRAENERRVESGVDQQAVGDDPASRPTLGPGGTVHLELVFRADWDPSTTAVGEMERLLAAARQSHRTARLAEQGFHLSEEQIATLHEEDMASEQQLAGATLGRLAVLYVMIFLLTGGAVVAADTIAGEKERGTLETLLTTAARRGEIIVAKQLVILTVGVVIAAVQLLSLAFYVGLEVIDLPVGLAVDLTPLSTFLLFFLFLPLAALTSSVLLLLSGWSKTYKEFQTLFFPVFVVTLLPAAAALLPGIELRSAVVLVPIANLSVAIKEVLVGRVDLLMIAVAWTVSAALSIYAFSMTRRALSTERLLSAHAFDRADLVGGSELFPRHVWRWFAAMWGLVFMAALNPVMSGLRAQILFNLVGVFLGGTLLMVWRYRLPVRQALGLRPVRPVIWLAVILGAPAALIANLVLARWSTMLFPIPSAWLEQFARLLTPDDMALWELVVLVAILPGICEELAFRGVLLHGLRRRFRPLALCLVVGLVFGLFHFELPRLLPTAMLGVVVSGVRLLTGSIYPAMVWHALNNATAIGAEKLGLPLDELGTTSYAAATALAGIAFWLIWRHRVRDPEGS